MIYKDFAYIYDKLMYDLDYEKIYKFIMWVLDNKSLEPTNILEMAVGTGNLTEKLVKDFKVDGFDLSDDMLSVCQNKINSKNLNLFKQNMVGFKAPRNYDAIFCVGDSLNYILDKGDVSKALESAFKYLNKDGILVCDFNTVYKFKSIPPVTVDEVEDIFYVWENIFDENNKVNTYAVNFFVEYDFNKYERFYEEHRERAYSVDEIKNILSEIGFKDIEFYDDYEDKGINDNTSRYTVIARR